MNFKQLLRRRFFQYKKKEDVLLSNKKIVPTSIRILSASLAEDILKDA